ncbi:hypothetical protein UFOVP231_44 [uncultured Caudovirales phage]|uniref:Uncharacterized protein n=1 Tax=uncultured Caudovirales phage TaxID=2100421 RepID=A0A6J7WPS3_9CAUD|nr:hypothetical protein UFOVP231_44 [uncultured Caudovirales phage]
MTYTTNKSLETPARSSYVDQWDLPLNGDMTVIDYVFGTSQDFTATAGPYTLGSYDLTTKALVYPSYVPMFLNIKGAITTNITYTIPSGIGGQWVVYNSTTDGITGPFTVTFASGGGGRSALIPRLNRMVIVSDGTNIDVLGYAALVGTSAGSIDVTGSVKAGTTVTAGTTASDSIGNLRNVPPNAQTTSYILAATDSGKYISITTGGVTVPFVATTGLLVPGQTISIYNNSVTSQTITQASGVTIAFAGTISTGNRTLAANGLCTLLCTGVNTYVITGAGVL